MAIDKRISYRGGGVYRGGISRSSRSYGPPGSKSRQSAPTHQPSNQATKKKYTPPHQTGGPGSLHTGYTPPKKKTTITTGGGGPPSVLNPPTKKKTTTVTTGGQSPFSHTKQVGITSNYVNPVFRKHIIDTYNKPRSWVENLQNIYGEEEITPIGYVPEYRKKEIGLEAQLYNKAIEEGIGPTEFKQWYEKLDFKNPKLDPYAKTLEKELQISDWDKIYPSKNLDVKGINTEEKQREALNTLMGELQTKKSALKDSDKDWLLTPQDNMERDMLNRELTGDYEKNKDRLNDLGITSKEEYEDFYNKAISLADGGIVQLLRYGGMVDG